MYWWNVSCMSLLLTVIYIVTNWILWSKLALDWKATLFKSLHRHHENYLYLEENGKAHDKTINCWFQWVVFTIITLGEQEWLTLQQHPSSRPVVRGVRVTRSLVLYVCFVDLVCPFVRFLLAIVLSVLLRYTDSDCPLGIFKLCFKKIGQ